MDVQKAREKFAEINLKEGFYTEEELSITNLGVFECTAAEQDWKKWWECLIYYVEPMQQAQKVAVQQIKQDLLDRVNARWELAHQQCVENWNTYSSAQMDAFDYIEQDINEILCENIIKEQEK